MNRVGEHFVASLNGHLDAVLAVARSKSGGVYPVGTVIQLIPTEAMVKRHKGYSPAPATGSSSRSRCRRREPRSRAGSEREELPRRRLLLVSQPGQAAVRFRVRERPRLAPLGVTDAVIAAVQNADPRPKQSTCEDERSAARRSRAPRGSRPCPRASARRVDHVQRARQLVAGEVRAAVGLQRLELGRRVPGVRARSPRPRAGRTARRARRRRPRRRRAGGASATASTSSGYTFSPPVLMHIEPRPRRCMVPSASTVAMSPGSDQRSPSISTNVRALRSGSLW